MKPYNWIHTKSPIRTTRDQPNKFEELMKILFIGFPFSIHTARWINQITDQNWDIHLYSSLPYSNPHQNLTDITFHEYSYIIDKKLINCHHKKIYWFELGFSSAIVKKLTGIIFRRLKIEKSQEKTLLKVIKKIRPDIIHTLETQHAGYLLSSVWDKLKEKPYWIHSTWGIDFHLFSNFKDHKSKIEETLAKINLLIVEGQRDIELAKKFGYLGKTSIFPSVGGGFIIEQKVPNKTSSRKLILLKGTQDSVRRGLCGLRALERCVDQLKGYKIVIYQCSEPVKFAAEIFKNNHSIDIEILDGVSHEEMLNITGQARISITTNISDGVPNTMLEAMLAGAFPIQSNTAITEGWIEHGINGFSVPPEDPNIIEESIRLALSNDKLVDDAAMINLKKISVNLNYSDIKTRTIELYKNSLYADINIQE